MLNHYHYLDNKRDGNRSLTFSRYAGPGSHRYPIGFSGDTVVSWDSLDFQPEFTATASNIGYAWWSHDIGGLRLLIIGACANTITNSGGHFYGYRDDELAARWVQLGVFSPILRLHSSNNPWNSKEPWKFTQESRTTMNEALRLRHQLIPYLYSMNVRAANENEPLVQPMYWKYPSQAEAYRVPNEFFFGSELIVVPMTTPRDKVTRRARSKAWLPPGRHVDIFSGVVYDGDCEKWLYRTLEGYAILAQEGAIIPLDAAKQPGNGGNIPEALRVKIIVGADGFFDMVEDQGEGGKQGEDILMSHTKIKFNQERGTVEIHSPETAFLPHIREWILAFPGYYGQVQQPGGQPHEYSDVGLVVKLRLGPGMVGSFSIGANPQLGITDAAKHIYHVVDDAQTEFNLKSQIWKAVSSKAPLGVKLSQLSALDMDSRLLGAIMEFMCADSRSA